MAANAALSDFAFGSLSVIEPNADANFSGFGKQPRALTRKTESAESALLRTWQAGHVVTAVEEQARAFIEHAKAEGKKVEIVMRDRDGMYIPAFDDVLKEAGAKVVPMAHRAPNQNAFIERWIDDFAGGILAPRFGRSFGATENHRGEIYRTSERGEEAVWLSHCISWPCLLWA